MINSSEKLEKFKSTVFSDAEEKANEMLEETRLECAERLKKARIEAEEIIRRGKAEVDESRRTELVKSASAGSLAARKQLLLAREELISRVFDNAAARVRKFTASEDYERLMLERLEECAEMRPDETGEVQIRPADKRIAAKLSKGGRFTVTETDSIILGGLIVIFPKDNLALDCTFDSVMEEQRKTFAAKLGG